ncbi:MAG TPA: (d)CMP kinase [Alphaproteobacteria bacterium]|nr:(d)CMP kinase [Alphaproteobacteria bacterium]
MIIAIDGPAAAGKGTLARRLARHYDLAFLDTGSLYRAVGAKVLRAGQDPADRIAAAAAARTLSQADIEAKELREERVSEAASVVAALPDVRAALLQFQRGFARHPPDGKMGAVLDGRDIGTVICPEPDVIKFFVHASLPARAERRFKELQGRGDSTTYARVLQDMTDRDERDRSRGIAALKPATDAYDLDTTGLNPDQVFQKALDHIQSRNRP